MFVYKMKTKLNNVSNLFQYDSGDHATIHFYLLNLAILFRRGNNPIKTQVTTENIERKL